MTSARPARNRPTLEEVAAHAGVSRASASRVINGSASVNATIRTSVLDSVRELGYVPNQAARSLVTRRSDLYALVLPEPVTRVFSDDQFFLNLMRGASGELEAVGKQLVLMLATSDASRDRIEQGALARHLDGVMFASTHGDDPLPSLLADAGVAVVVNGRPLGPCSAPWVDVDHAGGVAAAVRHLIGIGRRRLATIAGPQDMVAGIDRLAGFRHAIGDRRAVVELGDFTRASGLAAMERLLAVEPDLDAVFVASDLMADGALTALARAGRRVPEHVAVVGFDDVEVAAATDPPLTTVRQPIVEIGRNLAAALLRQEAGEQVAPSLVLPTELVVRRSA
jgi:DNA-binding LacI/PurR family transcriptional regulator